MEEFRCREVHWKRWGPYLNERAWGTVREDYSAHGTAWEFPHDHARSKAYRWNEDGIAGICDRHQCDLALFYEYFHGGTPARALARATRPAGQRWQPSCCNRAASEV